MMSSCLLERLGQQMRGLVGVLGVLGLVACASQPGSVVPVEDRTQGGARPMPAAGAIAPRAPSASAAPAIAFPAQPQASEPVPPPSITSPPAAGGYAGPSPVLLALMEQADRFESRGDRQGALAQLERAQRIAPRDPLVYLQLARLRLHMDDRVRAEQLARKGLLLSGSDPDLVSAFEALLAELKPR